MIISSLRLAKACSTSFIKRSFGTTHAILIGGGAVEKATSRIWNRSSALLRKHPNMHSYKDVVTISERMQTNFGVKSRNISVLFGNGDEEPVVYMYNKGAEKAPKIPFIKGAATLENIEREIVAVANKIEFGDRLWMILTGHGAKDAGTQIWSEGSDPCVVKPTDLSTLLGRITDISRCTLFVSSCYSGQYLNLTKEGVTVFTCTSAELTGYTRADQGNLSMQEMFSHPDSSLYHLHYVNSSALMQNHHASESLSYYVDSILEKKVDSLGLKKNKFEASQSFSDNLFKYYDLALMYSLLADPMYALPLSVAKVAFEFFGRSTINRLREKPIPEADKYIAKEKELVRRVLPLVRIVKQQNPEVGKAIPIDMQRSVDSIMCYVKSLNHNDDSSKLRVSSSLLPLRIKLFLYLATREELEKFIEIGYNVVGSLNEGYLLVDSSEELN